MHQVEKFSLEEIRRFVEASEEIRFESENRRQVYGWIERELRQRQYQQQVKATPFPRSEGT